MQSARSVLTPESLAMLHAIAELGSFAAAARALNVVPSALTYRVRQIEDALDVLLFDRRSRQAVLTPAGNELVHEGNRLLVEIDAVANRVKRVATGWETQLTIAVDGIVHRPTLMEMCEAFFALESPTRIKLRDESLSGTLQTLVTGQADLAIGVAADSSTGPGLQSKPLGTVSFVFAVAPHHPLAGMQEPLGDALITRHRAVAVADSVHNASAMTIGLLAGQDVFTVPDMAAKLDSQRRGLGAGFLPSAMVRHDVEAGRLIVKRVERTERVVRPSYAWRATGRNPIGKALQWWLQHLERPATRAALLHQAAGV